MRHEFDQCHYSLGIYLNPKFEKFFVFIISEYAVELIMVIVVCQEKNTTYCIFSK